MKERRKVKEGGGETEIKEERTMGGRKKIRKVGRKKSKTAKTNHSPYCKRRKYIFLEESASSSLYPYTS